MSIAAVDRKQHRRLDGYVTVPCLVVPYPGLGALMHAYVAATDPVALIVAYWIDNSSLSDAGHLTVT